MVINNDTPLSQRKNLSDVKDQWVTSIHSGIPNKNGYLTSESFQVVKTLFRTFSLCGGLYW